MENGSGISDKHAEELRQGLAAALAAQEAQRKQAKEAQEKADAAQAAQMKFAQEVLAKAAAAKGEAPVQIAAAPSVSGSAAAAPTASASDSKAEAAPETVSVGKGDSLWKIAKARSGGENIVAYMAALAEKNEAVLGSGIGKLKVGMKLELPTEEELASVGKVKVAEMGEQLAAAQKAAAEKAQRRQAELAARQSHRNESVAAAPEATAPAVQASASAAPAPAGSDAKAPAEPGLVEKAKSAASHAFEAVQSKASAAASGVKAWHEENSKAYREKMLADAAGYEKSGIPRDLMPSDVQAALAEVEREKSAAAKPAVQASAAAPQAPSGSDAKPESEGPGLFDRIKGKLSAAADGVAAWHEENAKAYRDGKLKEAEEYRKVGFGPDKMPEDVRKVLDEVARENEAKSKVGGVNWAARGARSGADHEEPQQAPTPKR